MEPAALGLTCKHALEVFSQNHTLELQEEVKKLRLENYHLKLPPLRNLMLGFNYNNIANTCHCLSCRIGERTFKTICGRDPIPNECSFKPAWEAYLQSIGATVDTTKDANAYSGETDYAGHGKTIASLFNTDTQNWVNSGWGKPLSSFDSPRKKVWDEIKSGISHNVEA
jgi:hypothetical protein